MCTAIRFNSRFFGRTFDYERSFGEEIILSPRDSVKIGESVNRYGIMGIGVKNGDTPLYFDGINEWGLCSAALNFPRFAHYSEDGGRGVWASHLNTLVLGFCRSVREAAEMLSHLKIRGAEDCLPRTPLHWIIADPTGAIVVEPMADGVHIRHNPVGVLTNSPPLDYQVSRLSDISNLSVKNPTKNLFSRGLGAVGLPGDFSSSSRFLRAAFLCEASRLAANNCDCTTGGGGQRLGMTDGVNYDCTTGGWGQNDGTAGSVGQAMDILYSVSIPYGAVISDKDEPVFTRYRVVADMESLTYYLTTASCRAIHRVCLSDSLRDGKNISSFRLYHDEHILE